MNALAANTAASVHELDEQEFWYCQRTIPDTSLVDGFGPYPYSFRLENLNPAYTFETLKKAGLVTFYVTLSPEFQPTDSWTAAGWELVLLKQHFVHNPALPTPLLSSRSRQNVRMARKHWCVEKVDLVEHHAEIAEVHAQMLANKPAATFTNYTSACIEGWAAAHHIETYAARDEAGFGVWAIGGRRCEGDKNELHLITIAAAPRAYVTGGFYAIYDYLLHEIGRDTTIFFGGTPAGGEGLARFKSRFANDRKSVWAAQATFEPEICTSLQDEQGRYGWFPPYRDPFQSRTLATQVSL